jgi:hypothetical protein
MATRPPHEYLCWKLFFTFVLHVMVGADKKKHSIVTFIFGFIMQSDLLLINK